MNLQLVYQYILSLSKKLKICFTKKQKKGPKKKGKKVLLYQSMPKANLWILNYCALEMKSNNEPTIGLPVYFKPVKKIENMFYEKTKKRTKKKRKKSLYRRESNPGLPTWKAYALSIAPRQLILKTLVKLIIYNTFVHAVDDG